MKKILAASILFCLWSISHSQSIIRTGADNNSFLLKNVTIVTDDNDEALIKIASNFLAEDLERVTGKKPASASSIPQKAETLIIIGTLKKSSLIQTLARQSKLKTGAVAGKWEAYSIQTIANPFAGVGNAIVVTGSDRRGAAYGVFEISKQLGVSPWYWWADVPVKKQDAIYVAKNATVSDAPKVKYRGFFINDEAPALSGWTKEKFGGMNHRFYEKVFELILRLKGNYLWPAMWGNAFNDDDKLNPVKAHEYGIVMGTSHHEPMLRAQQEWKRFGKGAWDYTKNDTALREFWKKGIENMADHESIVTVGMRGDGDMPMTRGTATALLEKIVKDQRNIIAEVTKKPASETPQLWALYKEVQDYYDKGMRVPDDVTLLLCDDNWGNVRKLPKPGEKPRKGGYGIYYHFDYVGGPRNYKWINTNSIPRVWEQMHLAYEHNVRDIWIVNVGDIKPMEYPISFFLDYAWNPDKIGVNDLEMYAQKWSEQQFGKKYAKEIASVISRYSKYNSRRKPEMVDHNTYSFNYGEWPNVVNTYNKALKDAEHIGNNLGPEYHDAYFQLVLHPVKASANLNEMYYNIALNRAAYQQKLAAANAYADTAKALYVKDSLISLQYNQLNGGKWNHMMDQKHIGYTSWQEPRFQKMPEVKYVPADSVQEKDSSPSVTDIAQSVIPEGVTGNAFYESEESGVSISAEHFSRVINGNGITWKVIPDLGRTGSAITIFPATAPAQPVNKTSAHVEYDFYTMSKGDFSVNCYFAPTLNFLNTTEGLQYAIAIDDESPQIISTNKENQATEGGIMYKWVGENIIIKNSKHNIAGNGKHTLKFWIVNPGVVLQKIVLDFGNVKPSYLGPPETKN